MRKSNVVSGCLFAALATVLLWHAFSGGGPAKRQVYEKFGNWLDQNVFGDRDLDERRIGQLRFMQVHDDLRAEYFAGRVTLEEVVDQIYEACKEHCPDMLTQIARLEDGATPQERIARNISRQVDESEELRQNEALRDRVQGELAELLRKRQKPMPAPMMGALAA